MTTGNERARASRTPLDTLVTSPQYAAQIGAALGDQLASCDFTAIVVWDDPESAVLAHVIGTRRQVPVLRAVAVEGLVELIDPIEVDGPALLLAPAFVTDGSWRALSSLVVRAGGTVVALAAVASTPAAANALAEGLRVEVLDSADTTRTVR